MRSKESKERRNAKSVIRIRETRIKKKKMLIDYKGGKCIKCGYNKCASALEFHHLNPNEKEFAFSASGLNRKDSILKEEVDKCILVCANCHREIHEELKIGI